MNVVQTKTKHNDGCMEVLMVFNEKRHTNIQNISKGFLDFINKVF